MTALACRYAILQFMPYAETGEFANVGVVMLCPAGRFFDFRLTHRHARITNFFPELDARIVRAALKSMGEELIRLRAILSQGLLQTVGEATQIFDDLIRPREARLRFGTARALLASDPKVKLGELFAHYVERNFATKEYREKVIEKSVREMLKRALLIQQYESAKIGPEDFNVRFPFVHKNEAGKPTKAIKPLNLAHDHASDILDHGGHWVDRVGRLKRRNALPGQLLFVTEKPQAVSGVRLAAYKEVENELIQLGAKVFVNKDENSIRQFAEIAPSVLS